MPITIDGNLHDSDTALFFAVKDKVEYYKAAIFVTKYPPYNSILSEEQRNERIEVYQERLQHYQDFLNHLIYN